MSEQGDVYLAKTAALGAPRPLEGVRVLALEQFIAAPLASMLLADAGANVLKLEPPGGEQARSLGPFRTSSAGETLSGFYARFNRGKQAVELDVTTESGREAVYKLAADADVFIENLRPGSAEKLGFGASKIRSLNPRIVYCAVSGFGVDPAATGPYSGDPAVDIVVQAMGGLMTLCGLEDGPPTYPGFAVGDLVPAVFAVVAILEALFRRERTGLGAFLDVAMYDSMIFLNERAMNQYTFTGNVLERGKASLMAPWGSFATADGWVALAIPSDGMWRALCGVIDRADLADDERTRTARRRIANRDDLVHPVVRAWTKSRTNAEVVAQLLAAGIPVGRIQDARDIAECAHVRARGLLWGCAGAMPEGGGVVGTPFRFVGEQESVVPDVPRLQPYKEGW